MGNKRSPDNLFRIQPVNRGGHDRRGIRRGVSLLPSLFTLANLFCGWACVVHAMRGEIATAAPFIGVATWQAAGVKVALNSDHMQGIDADRSLNPYNPFLALYTAVTRKTESGQTIGPAERVSRLDALRMMTADAAWLHFDETRKGTLEVGKLGDLAVLDSDYFTCPEEQIKSMHSVLTVVGGKAVHKVE